MEDVPVDEHIISVKLEHVFKQHVSNCCVYTSIDICKLDASVANICHSRCSGRFQCGIWSMAWEQIPAMRIVFSQTLLDPEIEDRPQPH